MTSGTYTPRQHPRQDRDVAERRRADLHAERPGRALRHDVVAHLAERVLGVDPDLALGHLDDARHLGHDRAARHLVEQLQHHARRLARLLEAHPVAGERVAVGVGPHLPVELVVGQVRIAVAAEVPVDAARADVRARQAVRGAELGRDDADRPGALLEDLVADQEVLELVARRRAPCASSRGVSPIQPHGRSSLRPPMRLKLGWKRPPVTASIRLSTYSRSRKP